MREKEMVIDKKRERERERREFQLTANAYQHTYVHIEYKMGCIYVYQITTHLSYTEHRKTYR